MDVLKFVFCFLLAMVLLFGGTGALVAELARRDCAAQDKYSPYNYEYGYPFTCVYVGVK